MQVARVVQLRGQGGHEFATIGLDGQRLEVVVLAVARDDRQRRPVEGPGPYVTDTGAKEAFAQLVAGLAGEGHRQHLIGVDLAVGDPSLDAKGQHVGLARTGGRTHQETSRGGGHRLALFGRQADEQVGREGRLIAHGEPNATGTP